MVNKDAVAESEYAGTQLWVAGQLRGVDQARLVLAGGRSRLFEEIVASLVQGTQFIALTGVRGVGKTMMAASVREELSKSSVDVRWVDNVGRSGIRLRTIMSQMLSKPETAVNDSDIEELFDCMTEREAGLGRLVLVIDDAEQLLPDAIGYLRLLASVAMERMPQIFFVGDCSFWNIAEQAGFEDLIGTRFELEPLSPREACVTTQRLMSKLCPAHRPVFDSDALELVMQWAGGLISRLFPLVAVVAAMATETDQTRVTTALVAAAVERLEEGAGRLATPILGEPETATAMQAFSIPADSCNGVIGRTGALVTAPIEPRRERSVAWKSGAAMALLGSLSVAAYWLTPNDIKPMSVRTRITMDAPNVGGGAIPRDPILIRLPASVPQAALNTSNYDEDLAALQAEVAKAVAPAEAASEPHPETARFAKPETHPNVAALARPKRRDLAAVASGPVRPAAQESLSRTAPPSQTAPAIAAISRQLLQARTALANGDRRRARDKMKEAQTLIVFGPGDASPARSGAAVSQVSQALMMLSEGNDEGAFGYLARALTAVGCFVSDGGQWRQYPKCDQSPDLRRPSIEPGGPMRAAKARALRNSAEEWPPRPGGG